MQASATRLPVDTPTFYSPLFLCLKRFEGGVGGPQVTKDVPARAGQSLQTHIHTDNSCVTAEERRAIILTAEPYRRSLLALQGRNVGSNAAVWPSLSAHIAARDNIAGTPISFVASVAGAYSILDSLWHSLQVQSSCKV